jgi:hypothetical protein
MKFKSGDYVMLGGAAEGEPVELTELELNLILGGYEPGYQESNPNANGWDLRGSSSGNGGAEGAGGQGGGLYPGLDTSGGGAGGGHPPPVAESYPSPPAPDDAGTVLFENYVGRIISAGDEFIRDGSGLLSIPFLTDVIFPPKPQT